MYKETTKRTTRLSSLQVDGTTMPSPVKSGVVISEEKVWSSSTGRTEPSGTMQGRLLCIKITLEVTWPTLPLEAVKIIKAAASTLTPWHQVTYAEADGETRTMEAYFGTPTYTMVAFSPGMQRCENISVKIVER
jgi:hypothetical protein